MIRPRLSKVASGTTLTTDLVNDIINRTEYAADLLRQYKLIAGTEMYVEPHYDGTRVSYLQPVAGGATPKQPISPLHGIVGSYRKNGITVGFIYDGTKYTDIVFPNATETSCIDIYNGKIVGAMTLSGQTRGFVYENGNYTSLESPIIGATSNARGIYENLITGFYTSAGLSKGYLYNGISYTEINPPSSANSFFPKIDQNNIVGYYAINRTQGNRGYITTTSLSSYQVYSAPGAVDLFGLGTILTGIHNNTIIGFYFPSNVFPFPTTSFTLIGGNKVDINYPGSNQTRFVGIYENSIVGQYDSGYFLYDGSTFTPIIAPSEVTNFAVFGIG